MKTFVLTDQEYAILLVTLHYAIDIYMEVADNNPPPQAILDLIAKITENNTND